MLNLSPQRLIDLWHQLEQCWDRENGFGTDTAEIYVFTLCDPRPSMFRGESLPGSFAHDAEKECGIQAAMNLFYVLKMFMAKRACKIAVNGKPFGNWLLEEALYHRCHVQVVRNNSSA